MKCRRYVMSVEAVPEGGVPRDVADARIILDARKTMIEGQTHGNALDCPYMCHISLSE